MTKAEQQVAEARRTGQTKETAAGIMIGLPLQFTGFTAAYDKLLQSCAAAHPGGQRVQAPPPDYPNFLAVTAMVKSLMPGATCESFPYNENPPGGPTMVCRMYLNKSPGYLILPGVTARVISKKNAGDAKIIAMTLDRFGMAPEHQKASMPFLNAFLNQFVGETSKYTFAMTLHQSMTTEELLDGDKVQYGCLDNGACTVAVFVPD